MNRLLAILINIITQKNIDLKSIGNINNIWGILIKLGGTYTRKIVEINLERQIIFHSFIQFFFFSEKIDKKVNIKILMLNKFLLENKSFNMKIPNLHI